MPDDHKDKHSILYCHECHECHIYFKSIKTLTQHKRMAHRLRPVYACANTSECGKVFDSLALFLDHAKLHAQKRIVCGRCQIKFTDKRMLRYHLKTVHYKQRGGGSGGGGSGSGNTSANSSVAGQLLNKFNTNNNNNNTSTITLNLNTNTLIGNNNNNNKSSGGIAVGDGNGTFIYRLN